MKKLISLALALVLSLSLIACGAKQDDTPQTGADTPDSDGPTADGTPS